MASCFPLFTVYVNFRFAQSYFLLGLRSYVNLTKIALDSPNGRHGVQH